MLSSDQPLTISDVSKADTFSKTKEFRIILERLRLTNIYGVQAIHLSRSDKILALVERVILNC